MLNCASRDRCAFPAIAGLLLGAVLLSACGSGQRYRIGGTVAGLSGAGLVLSINGTDRLPIPANGAFEFSRQLADGADYHVWVELHPVGQGCEVTGGAGTVAAADVTGIVVTCSDAGPLALVSSDPAYAAVQVARTVRPVLRFSAPLSGATVVPGVLSLQGAAQNHPVGFSSNGDTLQVLPPGKLLPLTDYTLTVSTSLRGDHGEQLPGPATTVFTTRDGAWQAPQVRSDTSAPAANMPRVAMDAAGHAVAVWIEAGGAGHLETSSYSPGTGWSTPAELGNIASTRDLLMNANGDGMAVWEEISDASCSNDEDCSRFTVKVRRYFPDVGWSKSTSLASEVSSGVMHPRLALNAAGNAVAIWSERNGAHRNIRVSRFTPRDGWHKIEQLTNNANNAQDPDVALDDDGNAMAVWTQFEGQRANVYASRYTPAGGWSAPVLIEHQDSGSAWRTWIDIDRDGNAIALWLQSDGIRYSAWSNRHTPNAGWGTAQAIESSDAGDVVGIDMAMDAQGNAVVAWEEFDRALSGAHTNVWANRYFANSGWGVAELLEIDDAGSATFPQIAMDAAGNALVVWSQNDGTRYNIWSRRMPAGGNWSPPALIETEDAGNAFIGELAIGGGGDAIAVWEQHDGSRFRIRSAAFE